MEAEFLAGMGRRIQVRRKALRYSQEELAEKADISKQTVSRAENGKRELGAGNLMKIALALGISTDYLLTGEYTNDDVKILNQKITNLTTRQFEFLEDVVRNFTEMCKEGFI